MPEEENPPTPDILQVSTERVVEIIRSAIKAGESVKRPDPEDTDPLERGIKAFMVQNYTEAHEFLVPAANGGSVRAQTLLARMFFAGNGVEKDLERYEYWLGRAADGGDKTAKVKIKRLAKKRKQLAAGNTEAGSPGMRKR